nr:hypothetical protein Iba_chr13bCG8200 [Ipomoea batatas]
MFYCALEIDVFGKLWSSFFEKVVNFACGVSNVGIFSGFECIDLSWFGKLSRAGLVWGMKTTLLTPLFCDEGEDGGFCFKCVWA